MEILAFFGAALPINYPKLWNAIVEKFTESLEMWQNLLSTL
jgi:hypothetical protein